MRPLEIIIPVILFIYLVYPLVSGKNRGQAVKVLPILAAVLTLVHLLLEKYRWQMVPIYVLTGVTLLAALLSSRKTDEGTYNRRRWASLGIVALVLLLGGATALPALLPVPEIPAPSGEYPVGTTTLVLTDDAREELYSGKLGEPRRFMAQVWYPAQPDADSELAPWVSRADIVAEAIASFLGFPSFFLDHLQLAETSSFLDAPADLTGGPYPVLLFSHGWSGFKAQTTFLMQELASHGYVVVGLEHTYGAIVSVFPDGTVAHNNPDALPHGVPDEEYLHAANLLVNQWAGDMAYALDDLADRVVVSDNIFAGMLDLDRVGVFGHSTGGGATIQFCGIDPRCKAGFPLDAFMKPVSEDVIAGGVNQPFAFFFSGTWSSNTNDSIFARFYENIKQHPPVMTIADTAHYDFSDLPLLSPIAPQLGLKGPLDGQRVVEIVNAYTVAFFDMALKGEGSTLFDWESPEYPEVNFDW